MAGYDATGLPVVQAAAAPAATTQIGPSGVVGQAATPIVNQAQYTGPSEADKTIDAVIGLGKGLLEEKLKQKQNQEFLQGAQKVMAGQAVKDIVDEQPWYTQIFGPTSSVQGARAYAQIAQVDKYTADLYGNMDHYATMSPEDAGKEVISKSNQFLTGDDVTDSAIQMKMVESLSPFFKAQAKAHYKWGQDQMVQQVEGSMNSAADKLQAMARQWQEGTTTPEDMAAALGNTAMSWAPPEGMSQASYWKAIEQGLNLSMAKGNHYMAKALWADIDGKGSVIDHAPAEIQEKLINARDTYEAKTKQKEANLEFGVKMGELQGLMASGQISPAEGAQRMLIINQQFQAKTGIDGDLYDKKDFATLVQGNIKFQYQERQKRAQLSATEEARLRQEVEIAKGVGMGKPAALVNMGAPKNDVDNAVTGKLASYGNDLAQRSSYLIQAFAGDPNGSLYIHQPTQQSWQAGIAAGKSGYNSAFAGTAEQVRAMLDQPNGQGVVDAYLGADSQKMQEYLRLTSIGEAPETAWQLAGYGKPVNTLQTTTPKEMKKIVEAQVTSSTPGFWTSLLPGQYELTPTSKTLLMSQLAKDYDRVNQNLTGPTENTVKRAGAMTFSASEVNGPYAWLKNNSTDPKLSVLIGASPEGTGRALADLIQQKLPNIALPGNTATKNAPAPGSYGGGFTGIAETLAGTKESPLSWYQKAADVTIVQQPDRVAPDGTITRTLLIMGTDSDGRPVSTSVDAKELREFYQQQPYFK